MAKNVLLDYAFKFSEVKGIQKADISYLKRLGVIVKAKTATGNKVVFQEVTNVTDAATYTDAKYLAGLFDGGLRSVTLILCDAITDITELDHTQQFTVLISDQFSETDKEGFNPTGFKGVVGAAFSDKAKAGTYAATDNRCAFLDSTTTLKSYGLYYAFGKLLSGVYWRDQQYIQVASTDVYSVDSVADAESLFDKKVSFYLSDEQYGKRLGFFAAGGEAITWPYIDVEIQKTVQATGVNYIALNQPRNTPFRRIRMESALQKQIDVYIEAPYSYLDPEGENKINIYKSAAKAFTVNGTLSTKDAEPIWRVEVEASQEVQ